jgi:hypothetical protein
MMLHMDGKKAEQYAHEFIMNTDWHGLLGPGADKGWRRTGVEAVYAGKFF